MSRAITLGIVFPYFYFVFVYTLPQTSALFAFEGFLCKLTCPSYCLIHIYPSEYWLINYHIVRLTFHYIVYFIHHIFRWSIEHIVSSFIQYNMSLSRQQIVNSSIKTQFSIMYPPYYEFTVDLIKLLFKQ